MKRWNGKGLGLFISGEVTSRGISPNKYIFVHESFSIALARHYEQDSNFTNRSHSSNFLPDQTLEGPRGTLVAAVVNYDLCELTYPIEIESNVRPVLGTGLQSSASMARLEI